MHCTVAHRWLTALSFTALLYGASTTTASAAELAEAFAAPRADVPAALPLDSVSPGPHVALILPAKSAAFARAAEAVREGFSSAAKVQSGEPLPVRVYPVSEDSDDVLKAYQRALDGDARLVVGPLTRSGVSALAASKLVMVPTLALNVPEADILLPPNLYSLSLQVESEARQVAQLALKEGRLSAITIVANTPLLQRIHHAFVDEFIRGGGHHVAAFAFSIDPEALARVKQEANLGIADMAFLALDLPRARRARSYLDPLFLYATSQVNPGNTGPLVAFDLAGVRFLDMPWLLQPDHPAVMIYPRHEFGDALDLERLYALGIDAFRVGQTLLTGTAGSALDGVTGRVKLGEDRRFARELAVAQFSGGRVIVQDSARP